MHCETLVVENPAELTNACAVQARFMRGAQSAAIGELDYAAQSHQLHHIGGDCFDFVRLSHDRLCVIVGDACGKGLAAALIISSVQAALRMALSFAGDSPASALAAVNQQLHSASLDSSYTTIFCGIYDKSTHTLRYVNAGHNPPAVRRQDGSVEWLETGGAPVGMFEDWPYAEGVVDLNSGDLVIAYTDGITEATNPAGEEWGAQGLLMATRDQGWRSAKSIVESVFGAVHDFSDGLLSDDATVMALRIE